MWRWWALQVFSTASQIHLFRSPIIMALSENNPQKKKRCVFKTLPFSSSAPWHPSPFSLILRAWFSSRDRKNWNIPISLADHLINLRSLDSWIWPWVAMGGHGGDPTDEKAPLPRRESLGAYPRYPQWRCSRWSTRRSSQFDPAQLSRPSQPLRTVPNTSVFRRDGKVYICTSRTSSTLNKC